MKKCDDHLTFYKAEKHIYAVNVEICHEQSSQEQTSLLDEGLAAFFKVDERMVPVPYYHQFEPVSDAPPLDTLDIENDEASDVSNMTPLSLAEKSSVIEDSIGRNELNTPTCREGEFGFVSDAASFAIAKIRGAMDDMAESIDPIVLEECQDGTRSMLGKPWLVAFDDFNNPNFAEVPATGLLAESTGGNLQAMTAINGSHNSGTDGKGCPDISVTLPRLQDTHDNDQSTKPANLHQQDKIPSAFQQLDSAELLECVGIIACEHTIDEIEMALQENKTVFDSLGIVIEVQTLPVKIFDASDNSENTPLTTEDAVAELIEIVIPKKRVFHRLKRMSHLFHAHPSTRRNLDDDVRLPLKILPQATMPVEAIKYTTTGTTKQTTRGSGKTVATVYSDKSTMHTEETTGKLNESSCQGDSCIASIRER